MKSLKSSLVFILKFIPMKALSYICGALARLSLPTPFDKMLCQLFAWGFRINMAEAEYELSQYRNIEAIFTRRLKPGMRPIHGEFCSPADGTLVRSEPATANRAIQVKGFDYSLTTLVHGYGGYSDELSWYTTVYLAPHNYHRVHSPVAGMLEEIRYFPGEFWPVNEPFVKLVPQLFSRNERLVFKLRAEKGGCVYVVMVGALNVGRIRTPFMPGFHSNPCFIDPGATYQPHFLYNTPIAQGQELGTFMLGSTAVVVLDKEAASHFTLNQEASSRPVMMGESL